MPGQGLALAAVHELKPASAADWPAAIGFALRLAVRRLGGDDPAAKVLRGVEAPVLVWCAPSAFVAEHGRLHAPGLATLGLPPAALLIVETRRDADTLWVLEEGTRSGAPLLVIGVLQEVGLTPARRLSLAAAASGVPCLLLTAPSKAATPSVETRWRVARAPSARHPFDPDSPGPCRLVLSLERCRGTSLAAASDPSVVEWCDVSHRFRLAAGLADRSVAADSAGARARTPSLRAG